MLAPLQQGKRVNVRVDSCDPVEAQPIGGPTRPRAWALLSGDVSEGGVQLSSPEMLAVNTCLLLSIEPEPWVEPIRAAGRVAWVAQADSPDRWKIGVTFTDLSEDARERLRALVASHQGS
jgi:hypothetical protein